MTRSLHVILFYMLGLSIGQMLKMSKKDLIHTISIGAILLSTWLILSGHYNTLINIMGILSCVAVVWITLRMDVVDHEGHPLHLTWRALGYWTWLTKEIIKANIDVIKLVLAPKLNISPTMLRVRASQKSDLGQVIFANSITLTPGTLSVDVANNEILVHALSRNGADDLSSGRMNDRVTQMTGE